MRMAGCLQSFGIAPQRLHGLHDTGPCGEITAHTAPDCVPEVRPTDLSFHRTLGCTSKAQQLWAAERQQALRRAAVRVHCGAIHTEQRWGMAAGAGPPRVRRRKRSNQHLSSSGNPNPDPSPDRNPLPKYSTNDNRYF